MTISNDDNDFNAVRSIAKQCFKTAKEHGWWEKYDGDSTQAQVAKSGLLDEIISTKLMLTVSELSEALEEVRAGEDSRQVYYSCKYADGRGTQKFPTKEAASKAAVAAGSEAKPEGIPIELADAVIRIMDLAEWLGIDLAAAMKEKMEFNETRPYKHGGKRV